MSGFTPGPWRLEQSAYGRPVVIVAAKQVVARASTHTVDAKTAEARTRLNDIAEANARLIASAPDLYSALEKIVAFSDLEMADGDAAREVAESALAKARGKQ